ncbi:MAG: hypothetical protein E2598_02805 [Sphingobium sp.]|nr:hypothetical protein [Sphingobium sp.]
MLMAFTALVSLTGAGGLVASVPALAADDSPVVARVDRLEKEMRAVQRKVFPAGTPVQPDIVAAPATPAPSVPSSTPVSDLINRVAALEGQLATVTGQVEQNSFKLKQLEDKVNRLQAEQSTDAVGSTAPALTSAPKPAVATAPAAKPAAKPATTASDTRKAGVAAVERPDTGNAANDAYTYGFRLWEAKFYPEAQEQLKATVEKYGTTNVASRAHNLLGRAYLDDGKPALASVAFYENYQKRPDGDRAAQSLTYLGDALIQLKKPADACKVYKELNDSYGATLSADLRSMMEKGRARAKCGA